MISGGLRPNRLWHVAAILVVVATFLTEPRATAGFAWDAFKAAGQFGGELLTDDDPHIINQTDDDQAGGSS